MILDLLSFHLFGQSKLLIRHEIFMLSFYSHDNFSSYVYIGVVLDSNRPWFQLHMFGLFDLDINCGFVLACGFCYWRVGCNVYVLILLYISIQLICFDIGVYVLIMLCFVIDVYYLYNWSCRHVSLLYHKKVYICSLGETKSFAITHVLRLGNECVYLLK